MAGWIGLAAVVGFIYIAFFRKSGKKKAKKKDSKWIGPAVALVILIALAGAGKSAIVKHAGKTPPSYHGPVPSGTLSCTQLEQLWELAGGSPSKAFLAAEVARAESAGREYALDTNGGASNDRGYWQINDAAHGSLSTFDPYGNARAAVIISNNGTDWSAWVTYNKGLEVGQC